MKTNENKLAPMMIALAFMMICSTLMKITVAKGIHCDKPLQSVRYTVINMMIPITYIMIAVTIMITTLIHMMISVTHMMITITYE